MSYLAPKLLPVNTICSYKCVPKHLPEIVAGRLVPVIFSAVISGQCVTGLSCQLSILQSNETITQAQTTNSGGRTAQVSARRQPPAHVTSSPVVDMTTERASDVNMTSSQVLEDGDEAMVNGGYFE